MDTYKDSDIISLGNSKIIEYNEKYIISTGSDVNLFEMYSIQNNLEIIDKEIENRTEKSLEMMNKLCKIFSYNDFQPPDGFITQKLVLWASSYLDSTEEEEKITSIMLCANIFRFIHLPELYLTEQIFSIIFQDDLSQRVDTTNYILVLSINIMSENTVDALLDRGFSSKLISLFNLAYDSRQQEILCLIFTNIYCFLTYMKEERLFELTDFIEPILKTIGSPLMKAKGKACKLVRKMIQKPYFLKVIGEHKLLDNITGAVMLSFNLYEDLFAIINTFLSNGYEVNRDNIYEGIGTVILERKKIGEATNAVVEFLYNDMFISTDKFRGNILEEILSNLECSSNRRIGAARLLLKYISLVRVEEGLNLARDYFENIFACIPSIPQNKLASSLFDLSKILHRSEEFVSISFEYDIDTEVFDELESFDVIDDKNVQLQIDNLFKFLHPLTE